MTIFYIGLLGLVMTGACGSARVYFTVASCLPDDFPMYPHAIADVPQPMLPGEEPDGTCNVTLQAFDTPPRVAAFFAAHFPESNWDSSYRPIGSGGDGGCNCLAYFVFDRSGHDDTVGTSLSHGEMWIRPRDVGSNIHVDFHHVSP
jgi:hypothetical protein